MEVKEDKKDLAEIIVQYSRNLTHVFYNWHILWLDMFSLCTYTYRNIQEFIEY